MLAAVKHHCKKMSFQCFVLLYYNSEAFYHCFIQCLFMKKLLSVSHPERHDFKNWALITIKFILFLNIKSSIDWNGSELLHSSFFFFPHPLFEFIDNHSLDCEAIKHNTWDDKKTAWSIRTSSYNAALLIWLSVYAFISHHLYLPSQFGGQSRSLCSA